MSAPQTELIASSCFAQRDIPRSDHNPFMMSRLCSGGAEHVREAQQVAAPSPKLRALRPGSMSVTRAWARELFGSVEEHLRYGWHA